MSESANLKRNIDSFRLSTKKISERISGVGDIWRDNNYSSLQKQMGELARASKSVIESGDKTCTSVDKFFDIVSEKI